MKVRTREHGEINPKHIDIEIDGIQYRLTESVDKKLNINKVVICEENLDELLMVFPRSGNEIELK